MKNLFIAAFLLMLVISYAKEQKKKQQLKQKIDMALAKMKKENLDLKNAGKQNKIKVNTRKKHESTKEKKRENGSLFPYRHYYIRGLGEVPDEELHSAEKIVEDFFGFDCTISREVPILEEYYGENENGLEAENCIQNLRSGENTIYLTSENLYDGDKRLRGFTHINGTTIVARSVKSFMKETLIHEIGHTLGLNHCNDLACIMAINNDEEDSGDFCEECKLKLNANTY